MSVNVGIDNKLILSQLLTCESPNFRVMLCSQHSLFESIKFLDFFFVSRNSPESTCLEIFM